MNMIAVREAWHQAVRRKTYALRDYARAFSAATGMPLTVLAVTKI
jgi:hypothetical protein